VRLAILLQAMAAASYLPVLFTGSSDVGDMVPIL
jgi:hypothetical protein